MTCNSNVTESDFILDIKDSFPMLDDNKVYLDSASTSFIPKVVIDEINYYLQNDIANYNRGSNDLVSNINTKVDNIRKYVADFINAKEEEIIFTNGATSSSELIVNKFAIENIKPDDEIMLCRLDHYSTINPWLNLEKTLSKFNVNIVVKDILIDLWGDYNEEDLISKISEKTKYIVLTHIHNVYGLEMGIKELVSQIREKNQNVKIVLDASQSICHIPVDVKDLDVDFLYFSGHKAYSPTGIGVLFAKDINYKNYEFGTLNILGVIGLGRALQFVNEIGLNKIESHLFNLTRYLYDRLQEIDGIVFNKGIDTCRCKLGYGIISFKHNKVRSEEINEILNYYKIYVRSSSFCQSGQNDYLRICLAVYNTKKDIDKLMRVLETILNN